MKHNRQFILSTRVFRFDDTWESISLDNGFVISYQQNLHITLSADKSCALIGDAWQVDPERITPEEIISSWNNETSLEVIYMEEESWCGRYIIITPKYVLTDATGDLGVFYTDQIISSSIALLQNILGITPLIYPPSVMREHPGIDYIPGCKTMCDNIFRLLPSQKFDYIDGDVSYRKLLFSSVQNTGTNLKDFEKYFLHGIENMYRHYTSYRICLPISGGHDSRSCMAALENLKKDYFLYTFYVKGNTTAGCYQDLGVSKMLSKKTNRLLIVLQKDNEEWNESRCEEYDEHTAGMITTNGRWMYACDKFNFICSNGKIVQVRNNIWELVRNDYDYHNYLNTPEKCRQSFSINGDFFTDAINSWIEMVEKDDINTELSFGDRVYWDLRCGCWLADVMQGWDIYKDIESVNVINCRRLFGLLMGLDATTRGARLFEEQIVKDLCPAIAKIPYAENYYDMHLFMRDVKSFGNKWRGKFKRKIRKMLCFYQ